MRRFLATMLVLLAADADCGAQEGTRPGLADGSNRGWASRIEGARHWILPATPNGLHPTQSWHATGSTPGGDIFVAGMDHRTNSALYRLRAGTDVLERVGDARSASEAAGNWKPGETAEKFHTRPLWHRGKVYVATMDRSQLDDGYLSRRGFHLYAFDPASERFADVSASEPGGTSAPHGSLVTLASDPARDVIYGAAVPTSDIYRHRAEEVRTEKLGRPRTFDRPYVYAGRVMWVDGRGRLYFTAGNPINGEHDPSVYGHVHFYDPATGFGERKDWRLQEPRALELGQCLPEPRRCFFSDDKGHVYRYDEDGPSWRYLGRIAPEVPYYFVWLFHVAADGRTAFAATTNYVDDAPPSVLYAFDLETGTTRRLISLAELDPGLSERNIHTGYDAWDDEGRFYFASFSGPAERSVMLTRIDPSPLLKSRGRAP